MIVTQTPLRISLLGGNTDFREYYGTYGGLVLTSTIDKYIYCIVKERFDDLIYINYSVKEIVKSVKEIKHDLVREAMKLVGIEKSIEITFLADIPTEGSGLGSSSAVTVGVLNALHAFKNEYVSSEQLAEEAIKIELDILKKPIGVQDQWAVALGGIRWIEFGTFTDRPVLELKSSVREDFNNSLMLLYTGITRKTSDILTTFDVKKNVELLSEAKRLAINGIGYLERGELGQLGESLHEYWMIKKGLNPLTSNSAIDEMYEKALNSGAIGGKVIGAGGGGFLLIMFPANKRAKVREALKEYKELPFRFSDTGSRIIFNI